MMYRTIRFLRPILAVVLVATGVTSYTSCTGLRDETVPLPVGDHVFTVEIADDDEERTRGLMGRKALDEDGGMLFVFPDSAPRSFWMKDTLIPLSIAYINRHGEILEIYDMEPLSRAAVTSRYPAKYALEVPQGAFGRAGITPGTMVDLGALPGWVRNE